MSKRIYDFPLPQHFSGIQDSVAITDLKSAGLWNKIPKDLQTKMLSGDSWFSSGVNVTAADLDELPDDVWSFVAEKLNLKWHTA